MEALVGHFLQPVPDFDVGHHDIELQTRLFEFGDQRHIKRSAQVAIEALDLAFGAGPIRTAQFDDEAAVLGIIEKTGVVTVLTRPIDVTLQDDGLHIVVEHAPRHSAQGHKGALVALDQRADFHVGDEFDVACPAVPQRGAEGIEGIVPFAEFNPIDLHLLARCRLEANDRIGRQRGPDAAQIAARLAQPP